MSEQNEDHPLLILCYMALSDHITSLLAKSKCYTLGLFFNKNQVHSCLP